MLSLLLSPSMWFYLAVVLGIMVLVHEFGHFAMAKMCGIRVEVFSIGFGKRIWGIRKGDTDYRLSILPLGGYVKMAGDVPGEAPTGDPGEFNAHPRWQRALVALAGPIANFILAIVLLLGVFMAHNEVPNYIYEPPVADLVVPNTPAADTGLQSGDTIVHFDTVENPHWQDIYDRMSLNINHSVRFSYLHNGQRVDSTLPLTIKGTPNSDILDEIGMAQRMQSAPIKVVDVTGGGPADLGGLEKGDAVLTIDGLPIHSLPSVILYIESQGGKPLTLLVERNSQQVTLKVIPKVTDTQTGKGYRIGFQAALPPWHVEHFTFGRALAESWKENKKNATMIIEIIKRLFTHQVSANNLAGPIGIGEQIHQAAEAGWTPLIDVMGFISVNLGILNLMPFPILDGGMLMFLLIEGIMRKDLNVQIKERVYQVAFVFLIIFAVFIFYNDISRLALTHVKP